MDKVVTLQFAQLSTLRITYHTDCKSLEFAKAANLPIPVTKHNIVPITQIIQPTGNGTLNIQ